MRLDLLPVSFAAATFNLTAVPPQHGVIASEYFSCDESGSDCRAAVPAGVERWMSAYANAGYEFTGWGGSCGGQRGARCKLKFDSDKEVEAAFRVKGTAPAPEPEPAPEPAPAPEPEPVPEPAPAPAPPWNLLKNPGFEDGLRGWTEWTQNGQAATGTDFPHSGKAGAYVYSKGGSFKYSLRQAVAVANGAYRASCWVRGGGQALMLVARDYSSQQRDAKVIVNIHRSNDFKFFTLDRIDVSAGSVMIAVYIEGQQSDWAEVDDCTLQKL